MLTTSRHTDQPRATIEHREGDKPTGRLLTQINVEETWTTNIDGERACSGLRVWVFRGETDERIEMVLP